MNWYVYVFIAAAVMIVVTLAAGTHIMFSTAVLSDNYKRRAKPK